MNLFNYINIDFRLLEFNGREDLKELLRSSYTSIHYSGVWESTGSGFISKEGTPGLHTLYLHKFSIYGELVCGSSEDSERLRVTTLNNNARLCLGKVSIPFYYKTRYQGKEVTLNFLAEYYYGELQGGKAKLISVTEYPEG